MVQRKRNILAAFIKAGRNLVSGFVSFFSRKSKENEIEQDSLEIKASKEKVQNLRKIEVEAGLGPSSARNKLVDRILTIDPSRRTLGGVKAGFGLEGILLSAQSRRNTVPGAEAERSSKVKKGEVEVQSAVFKEKPKGTRKRLGSFEEEVERSSKKQKRIVESQREGSNKKRKRPGSCFAETEKKRKVDPNSPQKGLE